MESSTNGAKAPLLKTGYTYEEHMLLHHDPTEDHPEKPARLEAILNGFFKAKLLEDCTHVPAAPLKRAVVQRVHSESHMKFVDSIARTESSELAEIARKMNSVYLCSETAVSAKAAAACTIQIARLIAAGQLRNGFALVRPPGHHAEPDQAMGFCILNNVAIAAKDLMESGLARRILIVDWDIHHGNGTQKIFAQDPNVLFISLHRYDNGRFYPGGIEGSCAYAGAHPALGRSVNVAWNAPGVTDADYFAAFDHVVMPIAREFCPDFVFVSAGFDAADGDPIGECKVTPRGYAHMTHMLLSLARGRVLLVLEGGYNVPVVASCTEACMRVLMGEAPGMDEGGALPLSPGGALLPVSNGNGHEQKGGAIVASVAAIQAISATIREQSKYWKSLHPRCYALPEESIIVEGEGRGDQQHSPSSPPDSGLVTMQHVLDVYWLMVCLKKFNLIPLLLIDERIRPHYDNRIFTSDNLMQSPSSVIVFAHERYFTSPQLCSAAAAATVTLPSRGGARQLS